MAGGPAAARFGAGGAAAPSRCPATRAFAALGGAVGAGGGALAAALGGGALGVVGGLTDAAG